MIVLKTKKARATGSNNHSCVELRNVQEYLLNLVLSPLKFQMTILF